MDGLGLVSVFRGSIPGRHVVIIGGKDISYDIG